MADCFIKIGNWRNWSNSLTWYKLLTNSITSFRFTGHQIFLSKFNTLIVFFFYLLLSVVSWQSNLLGYETGVTGENHRPDESHCSTLSSVINQTSFSCCIEHFTFHSYINLTYSYFFSFSSSWYFHLFLPYTDLK
jgi:hypothetical protein